MAASKKVSKKLTTIKVGKKPALKLAKVTPAKKSAGAVTRLPKKKPAVVKRAVSTSNKKPRVVAQPEWRITSIVADRMTVFGIGTDQRVYRWNPRAALWILHKEGLVA